MTAAFSAVTVREGLAFGEAPRWHEGRLYYADFYRHGVFSMCEDGSDERLELSVPGQPSGIGWMPDGSMLVVSMTDHRVLRVSPDGDVTTHADISEYCGYWANDMVVAKDGTAYVGNFGFNLEAFLTEHGIEGVLTPPGPPTTNLVVINPTGSVIQVIPEMAFPNGSVITPDGKTLIVAETMTMRLTAFNVADDGTLSDRRIFAQLELVPADGICLDAAGEIWVANALASEALRVSEGGMITGRVSTSQTCFACMLGGGDGMTLFAMTAPTSNESEVASRRDAKIETVSVDVPGVGLP
ncbi:MAG: SMP-30/gluconolactonase/LRE family protein [Actinomycetes bacterium]